MVSPGVEVFNIFLSVSREFVGVWRSSVPLPMEVKDAVDDEPLMVVDEQVLVGDVPREPTGGVCEAEWVGTTPKRRRGLLCGLSFGLGSLSVRHTPDDDTRMFWN